MWKVAQVDTSNRYVSKVIESKRKKRIRRKRGSTVVNPGMDLRCKL